MITSSTVGGGPNQLLLLARELKNNYQISVAAPYDDFYLQKLNTLSLTSILRVQRRAINLLDLFRLVYFLKTNQISIIHSHGKAAGVLGRITSFLTGIPLIHTFHGIHVSGKSLLARCIYILYEKVFGKIDLCEVYVSQSEKNMARKYFFHRDKISLVIPNGVNNYENELSSEESRRTIRSELNIRDNVISVVTLCSLEPIKNLYESLRIAKLCPELSFWIIGEGSLFTELQKWINKYQIKNVILPGHCKEPQEFLCAADIYFSSSHREGHPLSILEAMSVGLPVVASNVAGNVDTIENDKSGFFYDIGDISEASILLKRLASDPNLRLNLGHNAQRLQRQKFSSKIMCQRYSKLYSQINT